MTEEEIIEKIGDRFDDLVSEMEANDINPVEYFMEFIGSALEVSGHDDVIYEFEGVDGFPKVLTATLSDDMSPTIN